MKAKVGLLRSMDCPDLENAGFAVVRDGPPATPKKPRSFSFGGTSNVDANKAKRRLSCADLERPKLQDRVNRVEDEEEVDVETLDDEQDPTPDGGDREDTDDKFTLAKARPTLSAADARFATKQICKFAKKIC